MKTVLIIAAIMALNGCVSTSEVTPIGKDTFMIGTTARSGMFSHTDVKAASIKKATEFCVSKGKAMVIDTVGSSGQRGFTPLESELTFLCVDENDPENIRPRLRKNPDTVVEIRK